MTASKNDSGRIMTGKRGRLDGGSDEKVAIGHRKDVKEDCFESY